MATISILRCLNEETLHLEDYPLSVIYAQIYTKNLQYPSNIAIIIHLY